MGSRKKEDGGNEEWRKNLLLNKECGVPELNFLHPPVTGVAPVPDDFRETDIPNKFIKDLYIKYPFLIPNEIPSQDAVTTVQKGYTSQYEDITTYQEDFCRRGPVFPELVGARGMSLPDPDRPSSRFPGVPYLSRSRNPLSPLDKVDPEEMKRQRLLESKVLKKSPKITKVISEYEDNFNSLARYWKREELLTKSEVYVSRKHTLPQE